MIPEESSSNEHRKKTKTSPTDSSMNHEGYQLPCTWEERRVHLGEDQTLFIPDFFPDYASFSIPRWEEKELFGNDHPIAIEFCSGNGMWVVDRAHSSQGQWNWVSVEYSHVRAKKIWKRRKEFSLNNLFLVIGDARTYAEYYIPPASVDAIYINFPDPWPKRCHAKHRLIQKKFLQDIAKALKIGKVLTFATDDPNYAKFAIALISSMGEFELLHQPRGFSSDIPDYGVSFFESLWRGQGRLIHYIQAVKRPLNH
jgi:tRNA (guanine-N7-)-methyltransferase